MTGASARSEDETSRGARLKEDTGEGATSSASPRNADDTSRESSPREVRLTIPANEIDMPYYLGYRSQTWIEQVPTCSHITPGMKL